MLRKCVVYIKKNAKCLCYVNVRRKSWTCTRQSHSLHVGLGVFQTILVILARARQRGVGADGWRKWHCEHGVSVNRRGMQVRRKETAKIERRRSPFDRAMQGKHGLYGMSGIMGNRCICRIVNRPTVVMCSTSVRHQPITPRIKYLHIVTFVGGERKFPLSTILR